MDLALIGWTNIAGFGTDITGVALPKKKNIFLDVSVLCHVVSCGKSGGKHEGEPNFSASYCWASSMFYPYFLKDNKYPNLKEFHQSSEARENQIALDALGFFCNSCLTIH